MKPQYTITKEIQVGIYESEQVARVYPDKIIVVWPTVKWVGNSGGYHEEKHAIRNQSIVDAVRQDLADECEDSAWEKITRHII